MVNPAAREDKSSPIYDMPCRHPHCRTAITGNDLAAISFIPLRGGIAAGISILLLLSKEGRVVFAISTKRHAISRGDPFADIGIIILVEFDQINFLALGNVLPEHVEPFHSGVTG